MSFLANLAAAWNFFLVILAAGTLCWFVFHFVLRRLWRIRQINVAREKRLIQEAADRGSKTF